MMTFPKAESGTPPTVKKSWFKFKEMFHRIQSVTVSGRSEIDEPAVKLPDSVRPVSVAVINQKGGCGKTTTTVNLSAALAEIGYRVLVIDMDPQAHASLGFGISVERLYRSVHDLLTDSNANFADAVRPTEIPTLEVLPSSIHLAGAQLELANLSRGETALRRCLNLTQKNYDFIFIDCPPTLNLLTLNALTYASRVLIPIQTHYYALEGMKELFRTIEAVRSRFNPELEVLGIVATLFDKRTQIAGEMLQALRSHFGLLMLQSIIHSNVKLIEAPMFRKPITFYAPRSQAAEDFRQLAQEVIHLVTKED